ncbi:hypothetical protein LAZ67_X000624 [Cordylochernes scorpioides]|uniref:Mos1 transposase HTH domain-containing protein n=1 Tax=Cordylochernes scorpioides TaxID=51811 RepID=A0ABY6LUW6_9ARAC|nr:hypothetical protein LAZ67_X000624 [Cordylochernes scorpioides]
MTERLEQRYCIRFCQKLGDSQGEIVRKIQTSFGGDAMGVTVEAFHVTKPKQLRSGASAFFDSRGVAHHEYAPRGQSSKSTTGMSSVAYLMLCDTKDRSCDQKTNGASITTMLQHIPRT